MAATKQYSVVEYFSLHKSNVFVCSMNAVKAFDTVNHFGLLVKVGKRGACKDIFLLLVCWFSNLTFSVQWDNFVSQPFMAESGILQESFISPKLFNVYNDEMLVKINCLGYGCRLGRVNIASIAYADVLLVSGSLRG